MSNTQKITLALLLFTFALNIRLMYLNSTKQNIVTGIFKDVFLGREDSVQNYFIVNKKDTVVQNGFNSPKYPYLSKERNIVFSNDLVGNQLRFFYFIWYDGQIIENHFGNTVPLGKVKEEEERLKAYASERIKLYSTIKR